MSGKKVFNAFVCFMQCIFCAFTNSLISNQVNFMIPIIIIMPLIKYKVEINSCKFFLNISNRMKFTAAVGYNNNGFIISWKN